MATTVHDVRQIAMSRPAVVEGVCFGTPTFYLRGKLMLRLWEDMETLVAKVPMEQRDGLLAAEPDIFSLTEHYRNYPCVLVSLPNVSRSRLAAIIESSWRMLASKRQLAALASTSP